VSASYWLALALVAGGTLLFRLAFLGRARAPQPPELARRAMGHVPAAALAALALPEFINPAAPEPARLLALVVALAVCLATRRDFLAIAAGLAAYWLAL
jgi:branched-subunit amino acid transport protein